MPTSARPADISSPRGISPRYEIYLLAALLFIAGLLVYSNSFSVPMLLDDDYGIVLNPSIRDLRDFRSLLAPPDGITTAGRPLLNLSLALNYAATGLSVQSYHFANLTLHLMAGLTLFGLLRRTFRLPLLAPRFATDAAPLAAAGAALWLLHPLATSAVTYISQRAESMMGAFYLLTLYCFARSCTSESTARWRAASVGFCLCGMAVKEVMVTAPLLVLLYDRAFVGASFREIFARRSTYYGFLAACWLALAALMIGSNLSARNVGFNQGVSAWTYLLTQTKAVTSYLSLVFWPHPLAIDYGREYLFTDLASVWLPASLLSVGAAITVRLWCRSPALGFLPAAFFILLAPTSSVVPITQQPMAESRMYLPLAVVVIAVVCAAWLRIGRAAWAGLIAVAVGLGTLTFIRNRDYNDPLTLWQQAVNAFPANTRAHTNLAIEYGRAGQIERAIDQFELSLRMDPDQPFAHTNLAIVLADLGRTAEAIKHHETALRLAPALTKAHVDLATLLAKEPNRLSDALAHFLEAVRLEPNAFNCHVAIVQILVQLGRFDAARVHCETVIARFPQANDLRRILADSYSVAGRTEDAITLYQQAVLTQPSNADLFYNYGATLYSAERFDDALAAYERSLQLNPRNPRALNNAGTILFRARRIEAALKYFESALAVDPNFEPARQNLTACQSQLGRR